MTSTEAPSRSHGLGRGVLDVLNPSNPAAGANYSFTVGGLSVTAVRVLAVRATVATDSNVANRLVSVDYIGGRSGTMIRNAPALVLTASTSAQAFQWDQAHSVSEWNTNTPVFAPLADVPLEPGWSVQITIDNIQAGDAITNVAVTLLKYYVGYD